MEQFSPSRALLFGTRDNVPEEMLHLLERTGLMHLLSVSGWHMALAAGVAGTVTLSWRRLHPRTARTPGAMAVQAAGSMGLLFLLADGSGWSKPATRAFTAWTVLLLARSLRIAPGGAWTFAVSLAVSWALGNGSWVSFLLSAVGMAAILAAVERRQFALAAIAPWLATLPLTALLFHSAALLAPVYNFLALLGSAVAAPAFFALLWEQLGGDASLVWQLADGIGMTLLEGLARAEALLGGGRWIPFPLAVLGPALGAVWAWPAGTRARWTLTVSALGIYLWASTAWHGGAVVLNVGQGSAVAVADGPFLVDTGPAWNGRARAVQRWARLSGEPLEGVLITHPDRDHAGGLGAVLLRFPLKRGVWISNEHVNLPNALPLLETLERYEVSVHLWENEGFPWECAAGPGGSSNNTSPLCRITLANGKRLLLTGDMDRRSERHHLRENPELLPADALLVAHHGSKSGSGEEFLEAVGAAEAFISAGKNRWGHPHEEVLNRLREAGVRNVHITRDEGDLLVR